MEAAHERILIDNHVFLVKNLLITPLFLSHLYSNHILSQDLVELIKNEYRYPTQSSKASAFLEQIVRRGPQAFPTLVQALVESDQDYIADTLDKTIADSYRAAKNVGFVPTSPPAGGAGAANNVGPVPGIPPVGGVGGGDVGLIPAAPFAGDVAGGDNVVLIPVVGDVGGGDAAGYDAVDATNPEMTFNVQNASHEAIKTALTERYPMSSNPRGRAIIVNVENFQPESKKSVRTGSSIDRINLQKLCKQLGFTVDIWEDPTKEDLVERIKLERAREEHSTADTFMMFIMSHGSEGVFYTVEGQSVDTTQEVIRQFNGKNCKQLFGKPKMFFIQACQGKSDTEGVVPDGGAPAEPETKPDTAGSRDAFLKQAIHEDADILVTYATVEGYLSYRCLQNGAWFLRDLVMVFATHAHEMDVLAMLTKVSGLVTRHKYPKKQVCATKTSLVKDLYLLPGCCDSLDHA